MFDLLAAGLVNCNDLLALPRSDTVPHEFEISWCSPDIALVGELSPDNPHQFKDLLPGQAFRQFVEALARVAPLDLSPSTRGHDRLPPSAPRLLLRGGLQIDRVRIIRA